VVEEIIGRLPDLTESQLGRLEDELRREQQRRASSEGGGEGTPHIHERTAPPVTEVLEYRPHEDGYLQLELRRYIRRDGSARERGPTGTSSTTRAASVRNSTSARPASRRVLWPQSGQSLRGSRSLPCPDSAHRT
jgi:hypothetical protein